MVAVNAVTMETVTSSFGDALSQLEQNMNDKLAEFKSKPNPSQADLTMFQSYVTMWSGMVQLQSSVIKVYGDAIKQVVVNTGS